MWDEALSMLDRAERLQRRFFTQAPAAWEPPVDVVEAGDTLEVHVALPGVGADAIAVALDRDGIAVSAVRAFPGRGQCRIHRLEIPCGRFERRIGLSSEAPLELVRKSLENGVLTLAFRRKENA
jgi:HSP20 family molecular chaperone IbpA